MGLFQKNEHERLRPTLRIKTQVGEDAQDRNASESRGKPNDMVQGSFEESQATGKGPSQSQQGPKKVSLKGIHE